MNEINFNIEDLEDLKNNDDLQDEYYKNENALDDNYTGTIAIVDTKFKDTYSEFGGAYVQLGGDFVLNNTEFINDYAK